jgi:hypothetical protein
VIAAVLAWPAVATGDTLCVPSTSIPGCPASAANEPTIQDAVNNGHNGDTIMIGAGTYDESVVDIPTKYQIVGAGQAQTIIQGQGSPAVTVAPGSTISNLTINMYNATGETALQLAGGATNVAITATEPGSTMNNIGVDLVGGGTFSHGSITLPVTGGDLEFYGGVIGDGTVSDTKITAAVGANGDLLGQMPTLIRDQIAANRGIVDDGSVTVEDSLIQTLTEPSSPDSGITMDPNLFAGTIVARHVTVVGDGATGSVGLRADASSATGPEASAVTLASSILTGYATSVAVSAEAIIGAASTTVTVDHSFYDPATVHTSTTSSPATATISPDSHSGNVNPLFVNPAAGNFRLQAGSPAIDAGDPSLASGESITDLDGNPRSVAGRNGDALTSDVGAYEFQPHAPTVRATPGPNNTFSASGSDVSPGDSVTYSWSFDDGAKATGATVTHTFKRPGRHSATVTATDLDGFTATATVQVTVLPPKPRLTHLKVRHTTVSYRDSERATTTFMLERHTHGHSYKRIKTFRHHDTAGKNHLTLEHLKHGSYRLIATPSNAAGAGKTATVTFTIKS